MVDFICIGLLELQEAKNENYHMMPTAGLELTTPESQCYYNKHWKSEVRPDARK